MARLRFFRIAAHALGCLLLLGTLGRAQQGPPQPDEMETEWPKEIRRKGWHLFRRPARKTPAEQLAYAHRLRAAWHTRRAYRHYDALVRRWPHAKEAAEAQFALALLLKERGKDRRAFDELQYLISYYVNLFPYEQVLQHQFEIAERVMTRRHKFLFLFPYKTPERALPMFEKIVENGPTWERAAKAQFNVGRIHEQVKDYDLAVVAYMTTQHRHARDPLALEAAFRHAHCLYRLAKASPNDEAARIEAITFLAHFLRRHADSTHAGHAQKYLAELQEEQVRQAYERAAFYDHVTRKPKAAVVAYKSFLRKYPESARADDVRQRLHQLQQED